MNNEVSIQAMGREKYLDVAKAIALFFVILGHLVTFRGTAYTWIFSFHMMLFFFISGCQFNADKYKNYSLSEFLDKKVKSLLIPFLIAVLVGWILCLIVPDWHAGLKDPTDSLLYFAQPGNFLVGQIWFLLGLFWAEIFFFYLYKKIFCKVSIRTVIFITVLISIVGFYISRFKVPVFTRMPWKLDSSITALVFYTIGYYLKKSEVFSKLFRNKFISAALMVISGILGFYICKYKNGYVNICDCQYGNYFAFYTAAFCGIIFILLLSKFLSGVKILQYYGRNTLWMFIFHIFLLSFFVIQLNTITQRQYIRSGNLPFSYCLVIAILAYLILGLIPVIMSFCKQKFSNYKTNVKYISKIENQAIKF